MVRKLLAVRSFFMKKNIAIVAALGIIIVGGLYEVTQYVWRTANYVNVNSSLSVSPVSTATVVLDTGKEVSTVSGIFAGNAYAALTALAEQKRIEVITKQYDFGVFVQQIGPLANTKEKSWIYFVNGKAGTVAADKQSLNAGDTVEWKYMKPTIE